MEMTPQEELIHLRDRVAYLEGILYDTSPVPEHLGLSEMQRRLMAVLLKLGLASKQALIAAMYDGREEPLRPDDVLRQQMSKMRPQLARHGYAIENLWGRGYRLGRKA